MKKPKKATGRKEIQIDQETVIRPNKSWTPAIHAFLKYMETKNISYVPRVIGFDEADNEMLSFLAGEVYDQPLPNFLMTDETIISAAEILCCFHRDGKAFIKQLTGKEKWMLEIPNIKAEVMCHGDYAPYNVTIINKKVVGIIDYDTLRPATVLWDLAYGIYRWIPFYEHSELDLNEQIRRAKVFLDAYGAFVEQRESLAEEMILRIKFLIAYMEKQAALGESNFIKDLQAGHIKQYQRDIHYIEMNQALIVKGIM